MINPNNITTVRVGELPPNPPTLESKIPHELGTDLNYFTIQQLIAFLQPYVGVFQYETKRLAVTQSYIDENFDETGLGRNICLGWAIRNGNNGTDNIDGKVGVAYGLSNNVIGQTGGLPTNTISLHIDGYGIGSAAGYGNGGNLLVSSGINETGEFLESVKTASSSPVLQSINNMQPYIIDLYIIKL